MTRLFGTDGVRGIANVELTPELAFRLGEAAGRFLCDRDRGRIVVGKDTRLSGDMLEAALIAGVCSGGADALVAGIVPTPAVAHLTRALGADGGVVISASHNPAAYNGIKLFSRLGMKLADENEDEIEEFISSERTGDRPQGAEVGRVHYIEDGAALYVAHAISTISGDLSGMRIAVDCGHGAASTTTPEALRSLGAEVVAINCEWTGMDINDGCGSTDLGPLTELVQRHKVDFGIALDGDADRVIAVDDVGGEVDGDVIMAICAAMMKDRGELPHDTVVSTVMCNLGFEAAMRERGITVIKTKVGDRYVLEQMQASGALLGGEQSGHIIFMEHNTTGDGLITALQLAQAVRRGQAPLSKLRRIMTRYPQVLVNVRVADKGRLGVSAVVAEAISDAERTLGERGRVLVRASGTEALVRVMAEAEDEASANAVVERLVEVVRAELG